MTEIMQIVDMERKVHAHKTLHNHHKATVTKENEMQLATYILLVISIFIRFIKAR